MFFMFLCRKREFLHPSNRQPKNGNFVSYRLRTKPNLDELDLPSLRHKHRQILVKNQRPSLSRSHMFHSLPTIRRGVSYLSFLCSQYLQCIVSCHVWTVSQLAVIMLCFSSQISFLLPTCSVSWSNEDCTLLVIGNFPCLGLISIQK